MPKVSSESREPRPPGWKDFLLKHKWMPTSLLLKQFGIARYDISNFRHKSAVRVVLEPWRINLKQPPERLRAIFTQAWKYYLIQMDRENRFRSPAECVGAKARLAQERVARGMGFSFLTDSRYLEIACPEQLTEFRSKGFTNIALAVHQFWPGRNYLLRNGVLAFMFFQTHRKALEHVYLNFIAEESAVSSEEALLEAQERLYVRHDEPGFLSKETLQQFGVSSKFYKDSGGLRTVLKNIAEKYAIELGYVPGKDTTWSSAKFRKMFPERAMDACEYCGLRPVAFHHLLPREQYPTLVYEADNVVPLCLQVHGYITRGHWTSEEAIDYQNCVTAWLKAKSGLGRRNIFRRIIGDLHTMIYGRSEGPLS